MKAELISMNGITTDSAKVLADKLSLSRELATLKPELEHLRSQAASQQHVLAEKLSLQRQVSTLEVELETEKRASKRAVQRSQTSDREVELQNQLDSLQNDLVRERREQDKARKEMELDLQKQLDEAHKALTREKRGKEKAQKEAVLELQNQIEELQEELARGKRGKEKAHKEVEVDLQHQVEELQKELAREKRGRGKAREEAEADLQNEVEELHKELARERRGKESSWKVAEAELQSQIDELKAELAYEKREKERIRKETEKEIKSLQARETVLESKLEQLRTKLRATKEELKECQAELLSNARPTATNTVSTLRPGHAPAKKGRKRGAFEMSNDGEFGTPDGVALRGKRAPIKRGRTEQTMVGEKSMFSITPFLNRTVNMAPDTPDQDAISEILEGGDQSGEAESREMEQQQHEKSGRLIDAAISTPSADTKSKTQRKTTTKPSTAKKNILGELKAGVKNKKPAPKKAHRTVSTLEHVAEEEDEENEHPDVAIAVLSKITGQQLETCNAKVPQVHAKNVDVGDGGAKKKKRKLLGGKTLFDDEDGEVAKRPAKVALGPPRLLGKGNLPGSKGANAGIASSGFGAFSPLKKDRRGVGASFLA